MQEITALILSYNEQENFTEIRNLRSDDRNRYFSKS
jgi:hypothetical protein